MGLPHLDELIAEVDRTCESLDWIDRLREAAGLVARLQALGDDLVTEFVEHARFHGRSWAEIGAALGVTRQAAQQRFTAPHVPLNLAEFDEELQRALRLVKQTAIHHRHNYIGTEHLVLGVTEESNSATDLLASLGASTPKLRAALLEELRLGASQAAERIPWTPYARKAMALAIDTADRRGERTSCVHVILGLALLGRGVAADALGQAGIDAKVLAEAGLLTEDDTPPGA